MSSGYNYLYVAMKYGPYVSMNYLFDGNFKKHVLW
jgi:hypothetical protein